MESRLLEELPSHAGLGFLPWDVQQAGRDLEDLLPSRSTELTDEKHVALRGHREGSRGVHPADDFPSTDLRPGFLDDADVAAFEQELGMLRLSHRLS